MDQNLNTSDHSEENQVTLDATSEPAIVPLKQLRDEYQQAFLLMENRIVPIDLLIHFIKVIEYFGKDPIGRLYLDPDYKRFFFGEFLSGIIKKVCTIRSLEVEHQPVIHQFVMTLVDFFGQEIDRDNVDMAEAMRWLFSQSCSLHQNMFQHDESLYSQEDQQSIIDKLPAEEVEWRKNLKEGDMVDAVKMDDEYNLKMWSKAQISLITDGILYIVFEDDYRSCSQKQLPWYSLDLAQYNTNTQGDEWRKELKPGDYIDAYDSTKAWYQSIIQSKEVHFSDEREIIKYRIGFRMYHPEGNKEDDLGRKYFGWSEKFDETISAYSPRLQKFQTFAKTIGDSQKDHQSSRYEDQIDDHMDAVMYEGINKSINAFAVPRRKYRSALLIKFLNRFGEIGGFQKILDKINLDDNEATSIDIIYYYIDGINASSYMYNRVFINEFLPKLEQAVRKKILNLSQLALRTAKKDKIDSIINHLIGGLKARLGLTYQDREQEMSLFNLEVASLFLKQNFLEKRIEGAKFIQDVCKTANLSTFQINTESTMDTTSRSQRLSFANEVILKLKEGKVLYYIFSQERGHFELVQRSDELIKLFITQNSLNQEELEYIWGATKLDETTRLEIFKHFHELSNRLRESEVIFIINKLSQVPLNKVVTQELELVHELSRRSRNAEQSYSTLAIDYFWKIGFSNLETIEKSVVNYSINAVSDIIKNWDTDQKHVYVERLLSNLANNVEGLLSIKMLKKILQNFSEPLEIIISNSGSQDPKLKEFMQGEGQRQPKTQTPEKFKTKSNYICHLEYEYLLLESFLENFKHYIFKARQAYRDRLAKDPNTVLRSVFDQVLCDKFIHSEQVSERLEFLKYVLTYSRVDLQIDQLSVLWDELIIHALTVQDSEMFYKWLKEVCDQISQNEHRDDQRSLVEFFQKKLAEESQAFSSISQEGFKCMQSFIVFVNEYHDKIVRLYEYNLASPTTFNHEIEGKEFKSYSFNQNSQRLALDDKDVEFQVNCDPDEIDGIQAVWKIAVEANEIRVYEKAMSFLVKLYQNVSYCYAALLPEYDDKFFSRCITQISQLKDDINNRSEELKKIYDKDQQSQSIYTSFSQNKILPPEERKILRFLSLIKEYVRESERQDTMGVKSHSSLLRGELLDCIQISYQIGQSKDSRKLELQVQSNITLQDLKLLIARQSPDYKEDSEQVPNCITLYRYVGVSYMSENDNGKTLADLKFKRNEVLNAYDVVNINTLCFPLLNRDFTDFNDVSREVFTDVFKQYSVEEEQEDGSVLRFMNYSTCAQFTQCCTEEEQVTEEDPRILQMFESYNEDRDSKIKLHEFLKFYLDCCRNKEVIVRENLRALKYSNQLLRFYVDKQRKVLSFQQRTHKHHMPRYKLANNNAFFEAVFSLLDSQGQIAQSAWYVIKQLTTKPELYQKIEGLNEDPEFSWDQVIDPSSIYKILYTLKIIESMLEDVPETHKSSFQAIQVKSVWIEKFLSVGGFQEIVKLFDTSMSMISKKNVDSLTRFEKNFLEYMLKLVRIFIISAFSASDQSVVQLLDLVKRSSSIQEQAQIEDQKEEHAKESNEAAIGTDDLYSTPQKKTSQQVKIHVNGKQLNMNDMMQVTEQLLFGDSFAGVTADNTAVEVKEGKNVSGSANNNKSASATRAIENENDRFSQLARVMNETGLGEQIISQINFKDLHNELLEIISSMLGKKELIQEDALIMENNLSLWGAILMKNNNLIEEFYKFTRPEDKAGMFGVKTAEQMIIMGLYTYKSVRVREEFASTFAFLAKTIQGNEGQNLLIYLLELLQKTFPREDQYYLTRESKQYFDLFNSLIDEYFEQPQNAHQFDMINLLKVAVAKLKRHQAKETRNSQAEDKTLIGYFQLLEKLLVNLSQHRKEDLQQAIIETGMIHELFYEQLFFNPNGLTSLENKCKTKDSRTACYSLLLKTIESLEPKELADFLEDDLWAILKGLSKPKSWKYVPADNSKQSTSYCGITNLGNICYMIAMLQQFFMIPQFRYQLLRAEDDSKQDIVQYKGQDVDDNMLRQLQRMFGYLELSEKQEFNPFEFCFSFKDYEGRPTNTAIQADTQEFLNIFFDRLENILKPTSQRHLLDGVFGGNNCSQLICQSCGKVKNIKESFYNLSVPVKDRKGLNNSLAKMIEGSIINDYKCDACNQKVDVFKRTLIGDTPNVLIVHLQRLVFNFDTFQNDKVNTRFEFPNSLDLKEYSFKHVMEAEGKQISPADEQEQEYVDRLMNMDEAEFIYKLVGVIIHRGTGQHGHYWSLINTKRGSEELDESKADWIQTERDTWREFNDETVKYFSFGDLKQEAFGGANDISGGADFNDDEMSSYLFNIGGGANSYGKNAYILVYERKKKKDLLVLQKNTASPEAQDQTLECADTANSRDSQQQEVVEVQQPYRKIEAFVPDWIRAEVSSDNMIFLMDRYIYCEPFFNFIKAIYKHISNKVVLQQHRYSLDYLPNFAKLKKATLKLTQKVVFELLAYYYYNNQLGDILFSFQSIIQFCDSSYGITHGQKSILFEYVDNAYFQDNLSQFFKVAIECTDTTSRNYICKFTAAVINKIYQIWDDAEDKDHEELQAIKAQADSLLVHFVATVGENITHQNWSKMSQFLQMLYDIAVGGKTQCRRLLSATDTIPHLIEFVLGNRSPFIKNVKQRKNLIGEDPDFEPIVRLICLLTRYTLTKEMLKYEETWDAASNPPPTTLLGYSPHHNDKYNRFELSDNASSIICNSIFIDMIQYRGYDTLTVGNFLAHLSYKSLSTTRLICDKQLRGISKNDFDRVKYYLDAVTQIVQVKDNLQILKLEWIFGIAQPNAYDVIMMDNDSRRDEPKTRIGCKVLFSNNDEVNAYKTFLCSQDSLVDSLLHLLWRYKGKMDSYIVQCLVSLIGIIISDDAITEWFSNIPGPTYQFARYTDWIKPYLDEQLADARKGYAGSFSKEKEENAMMALNLHSKYQRFLDNKDGVIQAQPTPPIEHEPILTQELSSTEQEKSEVYDIEENVRNLIDKAVDDSEQQYTRVQQTQAENSKAIYDKYSRVIPCTPQPYIIAECIQENNVAYIERNGVGLQTVSLDCYYTKSEPTGFYNLAMPKNLFRNFRDIGRNTKVKSREQDLQAKCIDNYFQSSSVLQKKPGSAAQITIIKDDDQEWSKVNAMNQEEANLVPIDEDTGYTQDNEDPINHNENAQDQNNDDKIHNSGIDMGFEEDEVNTDYQNLKQAQTQDNYNDVYTRDRQEHVEGEEDLYGPGPQNQQDGNQAQGQGDQVASQRYEDHHDYYAYNNPQGEPQFEEEQDQQIIWPNGLHIDQGLLLKFVATNNNLGPVKICLEFVDPYADSDYQDMLNGKSELKERYYYPRGLQEYVLNPTQTKTLLFVQKVDPWTQSQTYEKLVIINVTQLEGNSEYQSSQREGTAINHDNSEQPVFTTQQLQVIDETEDQIADPAMNVSDQNIKNVIDGIPQDEYENQNGNTAVTGGRAVILEDGMKECPDCTYHNEPTSSNCEICECAL